MYQRMDLFGFFFIAEFLRHLNEMHWVVNIGNLRSGCSDYVENGEMKFLKFLSFNEVSY